MTENITLKTTKNLTLDDATHNVRVVRTIRDGPFLMCHLHKIPKSGGNEQVSAVLVETTGTKARDLGHVTADIGWPTASGRTMMDGPIDIEDIDKTDGNKAIVQGFVENLLQGGRADKVTQYISTKQYDQHNPHVEDGLTGFGKHLQDVMKNGLVSKYIKVHHLIGQGNFVAIFSHVEMGYDDWAFVDIFRLKAGKIVEHWDVQENLGQKGSWEASKSSKHVN